MEENQTEATQEVTSPEFQSQPIMSPKPRSRKKIVVIVSGILLLLVLFVLGYFLLFANKEDDNSMESSSETPLAQNLTEDTSAVRMLATGDFIAHDAINAEAKQDDGYSYAAMLEPFKAQFADYDVKFCNQATLAGGEKYGITGYPIFNAPFEWIHDMKGVGCNAINTGTNHTNDKGQGPITAQLDEWDKQNVLAVAGANRSTEEQAKVRYFESKGVKFALLSYSTYSNAPNPNPYSLNRFTDELVLPQMEEARANADMVIVSMRWGTEYSDNINAVQDAQAQKLANLGADIVLGHGTHTLQPVKRLTGTLADGSTRETIVWYGLGNFLNAQLETGGLTGCVATFTVDTATKKLTDSTCLPFYQHYEWSAADKTAEKLLARKNFLIMPLYSAQDYMAKSQLNTTVEEQMTRISGVVNTYTKVSVQNGDDL